MDPERTSDTTEDLALYVYAGCGYCEDVRVAIRDLGLTIAICKDAGNLAPDAAAACTGATAKALQWSIVIFATLYGWAALHYHWAGKTLQRDMITRAA